MRRSVPLRAAVATAGACSALALLLACGEGYEPGSSETAEAASPGLVRELEEVLASARRIETAEGWFEILRLPNDVYAFWEPGHAEKVNSFLILGSERDVLYDTGMGFASIGRALEDLRQAEGLGDRPLMVVNSHNHLDHNGGNGDFDQAWIIEDEWAVEKLTRGIPAGPEGGFLEYWSDFTPEDGGRLPEGFAVESFSIPPFPRENIRFLRDGDVVDLGDRRFRVLHTTSHSPDGLALYDEENRVLFGGDTFLGDAFLVRDLELLAVDLERAAGLDVEWHYCSHGPQLVEVNRSGHHLAIVRRLIGGEVEPGETSFAGQTFPLYELEGVSVTLAGDFLIY